MPPNIYWAIGSQHMHFGKLFLHPAKNKVKLWGEARGHNFSFIEIVMIPIRKISRLFVAASKQFMQDEALKLSASLSYYTVFAMGPLILIVISLAGIFFGKEAIRGKIFGEIKGLVGNSAALQLQTTIAQIEKSDHSISGAIIGFIIMLVGATGVFAEIQGSINYLWSIKAKPKKSWVKHIVNRLLSFAILVAISFVLMVTLIINALLELLNNRLAAFFPNTAITLFNLLNHLTILLVITALFTIIFRVLPDAWVSWKDAFLGAVFTACLFLLGKLLIGLYLGNAEFGITYGAAASIMVLLVWVYYTSIILFFGAALTKNYALTMGNGIKPKDNAVYIIKTESKEIPKTEIHGS